MPDRDHTDQFSPDCEGHKQSAFLASLTQGVISVLSLGMTFVPSNHQRLGKKHILGFLWSHIVPVPVFLGIGPIPFESDTLLQWISGHKFSILPLYTDLQRA